MKEHLPQNRKKKIGGILLKIGLAVLAVILIVGAIQYDTLIRLYRVITLFDEQKIDNNFRQMDTLFDSRIVRKGDTVFPFQYQKKLLPESYVMNGEQKSIQEFIQRTHTTSLVVVKDDTILYEEYYRGNTEMTRAISWSTCKSLISALFGIAMADNSIQSVEQRVTDYLPFLSKSGYNRVKIKDVLQMSSGVLFNEDYSDFDSDINRMSRSFAFNTPLSEFVASLKAGREPGTFNHYVSMDTQVLGMIITEATGKTLAEFTEEKLWKPLGMEADAFWLIDSSGMEAAFGGFNAIARDYARFGRLFLKNGNWNGKQIIPENWIKASITPDAPHLVPGRRPFSSWILGYGYQWWIPENPDGDFLAIGIYGQAIYIYPKYEIVIVKTSAYPNYNLDGAEMEIESIEFFRAIARGI